MICSTNVLVAHAEYDHKYSTWAEVLSTYAHNGRINYQALKANENVLKRSVQSIEILSRGEYGSFGVKQKMAFWINAYNMGVIKTIVENYPIKRGFSIKSLVYPANSIQQIANVWDKPVLRMLGQDASLNEIENNILRSEFKDSRVHFVIVCASIGCPVIRSEAYTAENLDRQLLEQIHLFLSDPEKVRYERIQDVLYVSPIFKWFGQDFQRMGGVIAFIKKYAPADSFNDLSERTKIEWLGYDWNLNEDRFY
jgi:hypothetical protein